MEQKKVICLVEMAVCANVSILISKKEVCHEK